MLKSISNVTVSELHTGYGVWVRDGHRWRRIEYVRSGWAESYDPKGSPPFVLCFDNEPWKMVVQHDHEVHVGKPLDW